MNKTAKHNHAFSMIELVIVVVIMGIIAAIAIPRFADASSGKRLLAAKRTLQSDMDMVRLRARATGIEHVVKFYPDENMYLIVEGTEIAREAVILKRDFDDDPFNLGIRRTNIGGDEVVGVTVYGDFSPAFAVGLFDDGTEISVSFTGTTVALISATETLTDIQAKALDVAAALLSFP